MTERRIRRWLRFSVRGLLLATTVLGVWLGFYVRAAREQAAAVAEIKKHGGATVAYTVRAYVPKWVARVFGDDFAYRVTAVYGAKNKALPDVGRLQYLEQLNISDWHATDVALAHIRQLKRLTRLEVHVDSIVTYLGARHVTPITDRSLEMIGRLPRIEHVQLSGARFSDDGVRALCRARTLKHVYLTASANNVTAEGVRVIEELPHLEGARLWGFDGMRQVDLIEHFKQGHSPLSNDAVVDAGPPPLVAESPFPTTVSTPDPH